jgi:hypothetical protein
VIPASPWGACLFVAVIRAYTLLTLAFSLKPLFDSSPFVAVLDLGAVLHILLRCDVSCFSFANQRRVHVAPTGSTPTSQRGDAWKTTYEDKWNGSASQPTLPTAYRASSSGIVAVSGGSRDRAGGESAHMLRPDSGRSAASRAATTTAQRYDSEASTKSSGYYYDPGPRRSPSTIVPASVMATTYPSLRASTHGAAATDERYSRPYDDQPAASSYTKRMSRRTSVEVAVSLPASSMASQDTPPGVGTTRSFGVSYEEHSEDVEIVRPRAVSVRTASAPVPTIAPVDEDDRHARPSRRSSNDKPASSSKGTPVLTCCGVWSPWVVLVRCRRVCDASVSAAPA